MTVGLGDFMNHVPSRAATKAVSASFQQQHDPFYDDVKEYYDEEAEIASAVRAIALMHSSSSSKKQGHHSAAAATASKATVDGNAPPVS